MDNILQFLIDSGILYMIVSTLLTVGIGFIVGKGVSFKEIQDIIGAIEESYEDGYISPDEARKIYKEIEDVIGQDWYIRLFRLFKR
jgi:hypothetical protein